MVLFSFLYLHKKNALKNSMVVISVAMIEKLGSYVDHSCPINTQRY